MRPTSALALCTLLLAGCSTLPSAPVEPTPVTPLEFKHQAGWLAAANATLPPSDATQPPQAWWLRYDDDTLAALMQAIDDSNPSLAQAHARWRQAQASIASAQATSAVQVGVNASATRSGTSNSTHGDQFRSGLSIGWAPDLWGRTALRVEAAQATAQAAQADVASARLALQLSTAESYVQLRMLELQRALLQETERAYQRTLELTTNQYQSGFVARADVIQAQTQWQSVRTQLTVNERQYALTHNAIATLTGRPPSALTIPSTQWQELPAPPALPQQLPSALLLQRPDIAAAQHLLAASNAQRGLAETAWLPDLDLNASGALQASSWSQFINAPLRVWSFGPALAASLFDGGARQAAIEQAQAATEGQAAAWRGQVLQAIQEVEDALASSAWLHAQHQQQAEMVTLAQESLRVMQNQYEAGMVSYLDVAIVQNQELASRRTLLEVQAQQLLANMQLVAALGGGWSHAPSDQP